jgi:ATPase family AAA domain-containing protein 3A/B
LGKPSLVRETSRRTVKQFMTHPIKSVREWTRRADTEHVLNGVIFRHDLEYRLQNLARATANTKMNQAPFRHMLFHGPPGTGKTLFSKRLAFNSGMEYAIMTGGDIAPLGKDAVTEIHKLFDWAETSRKGVLLFIDEADAFLQKRTTNQLTPEVRNALNALLYRTGEASNNFMLVLSTNQPSQFDSAINDRIDEIIEFGLPHEEERLKMIKLYFNKYINYTTPSGKKINFLNVTDSTFEEFAKLTKGFSGREISKLAIAWQSTAFGTPDLSLTPELMHLTLNSHLESHKAKDLWNAE